MVKRVLLAMLCLPIILLWGCQAAVLPPSSDQNNFDATSSVGPTTGGDDTMEIAMTAQEIELLIRIYPGEELIRQGKLFSHQAEALRQLRAAMSYLDQKYPGHAFAAVDFRPTNTFNPSAVLTVEDGKEYTVYAEKTDDGFACSDNCYEKYLQPRYDQCIEEVLSDSGYSGISYTRFPSASAVLGPETTVEELLQQAPKQTRMVDLFVIAEDRDATAKELQSVMTQKGFYGSYTLYFVSELTDIQDLESLRSDLEHIVFNCFDI